MEKFSSFDRVIAPGESESDKKDSLIELGQHLMSEGGKYFEGEKEKTRDETEICQLINQLTNDLRIKYGLEPFNIPIENIHIFDWEPIKMHGRELSGKFFEKSQNVFMQRRDSKLFFADALCHEIIHFKSYGAIQIPINKDDELDYQYRSGFLSKTRDARRQYFNGVDEAITQILTKRIIESLKLERHPLFVNEIDLTSQIQTEFASKQGRIGDFFRSKNLLYAYYLSESDPRRKKYTVDGRHYSYEQEMEILDLVIDKIFQRNANRFSNREEVFNLFVKGKLQGNFLDIGRVIDITFGKGTFRKIGELSSRSNPKKYRRFVESL